MEQIIHVLLLEDDSADAELIQANIEAAGLMCQITCTKTRGEFEEALRQGGYDIILADFKLPMYDGMSALRLARELHPDIPFIFVSGTMGEDAVIEGLTEGATDYVLKQRISRLASAIPRALHESENKRERHRIEDELRSSEARFRTFVNHAADAFFLHDEAGNILDVNHQACESLGYSREELMGMTPYNFDAITDPTFLDQMEARLNTGEVIAFDTVHRRKDGSVFPVEVRVRPFWQGQRRFAVSLARDITERKQAEHALRKSEARLNGIIVSAMDAIIVINKLQKIVLFNPTAERVFGYTAEEVIGRPLTRLMPKRFHQQHEKLVNAFGQANVTNRQMGQNVLYGLRKDGHEFPIEVSISQSSVNGEQYFTAILRDITKHLELEGQLIQTQKMEAIGLLAGGIAHDFNNLLTPIMMSADLAMMKLSNENLVYEQLQQIQRTAIRAKQLTQQILSLSRKQILATEILQINDVVRDISNLLHRLIEENIRLKINLQDNLPLIKADVNQLGQIIMNLAINARDAMPNGGVLEIETALVTLDQVLVGLPEDILPGSYVLLSVSDTGMGMDEKVKHRLFEPFFTTKEAGRGTGLGLSTILSIAQRHNGYIQFDSRLGKGTVFRVYLPLTPDTEIHLEKPTLSSLKGDLVIGNILIVEDETAVRMPLAHALQLKGHHVLEAANGEEALQIASTFTEDIHLLLTDMMMPGMNGFELWQRLVELFPAIKVLYMSGYSGDIVEQLTLSSQVNLLQKPFTLEQLAKKIQMVLNAN